MKDNPLIHNLSPEPFEAQKSYLNKLEEESIELQRLCFEIFHMSDIGKKLYKMLQEKYIIPSRFSPNHPQASTQAVYWEGFKEALRGLWDQGLAHEKRIQSGGKR